MIEVQILDEHFFLTAAETELLNQLVQTAAKKLNLKQGEVSIVLVNNEEIQELNRRFRCKDQPTDVLSFPMNDDIEAVVDDWLILGDVIISVPKAREQAAAYGHSFERELGFLLVHGLLHLVGYTHDEEEEAQAMFQLQEEILKDHQLFR